MSIRTEEARVFKTKERAPLLLVFEAYRPSEIFLETIPEPVEVLQFWLNKKYKKEIRAEKREMDHVGSKDSGFFTAK